jgi:predicted nucleic acid-binding protein
MSRKLYVFLDANVLFSASYKPDHRFLRFWGEPQIVSMTSLYAAEETRRNCSSKEHRDRLERLLEDTFLVSDASGDLLPAHISLPGKDSPILAAAIRGGAHYLITGDKLHFSKWMNQPIKTPYGSIVIMLPMPFLESIAQGD